MMVTACFLGYYLVYIFDHYSGDSCFICLHNFKGTRQGRGHMAAGRAVTLATTITDSDCLAIVGPFKNSEVRPTFVKFIMANSGKRSVMVLDEFEKTKTQVQDSLLRLFQEGLLVITQSHACCSYMSSQWLLDYN